MKQFLIILASILAVCVVVFFGATYPNSSLAEAANGQVDLSKVDWQRDAFSLGGEWELYYGQLLDPADFAEGAPRSGAAVTVPAAWQSAGYDAFGYGTYRLRVRVGEQRELLLFVPEIIAASKIWINGEHVFSAGTVGTSANASRIVIRNEAIPFTAGGDAVEILVQVSNYDSEEGGLYYPLQLGSPTRMLRNIWGQRAMLLAALGGIFLIGLYHLILYLFRRRERSYLLFALICLLTVLRMCFETNSLAQTFLPGGMGLFAIKLYYLSFVLHCAAILAFMIDAFRRRLGRVAGAVLWGGMGVVAALCIAAPLWLGVYAISAVILPYLTVTGMAFRSKDNRGDPYHALYLCSIVLFTLYGPVTKLFFDNALFVPGIVSNLFMVLAQCVLLARRYARAHEEVEHVNANLEMLIAQRTDELQRTNEMLNASQSALREMIRNISHDLKTPLTVLNNFLELLQDKTLLLDADEQSEYLDIAYRRNLDLQRLVNNLLEATRLESRTMRARCRWIPAGELAAQLEAHYAAIAAEKNLAFCASADAQVELFADPDKLWSVLDNVFYNALRHTQRGHIEMRIDLIDGRAQLEVRDSGCGISPDHLPHIFEKFYQVSAARGHKDGSSGIGLYIVENMMQAMDGQVDARSTLGKGTTIRLLFTGRKRP